MPRDAFSKIQSPGLVRASTRSPRRRGSLPLCIRRTVDDETRMSAKRDHADAELLGKRSDLAMAAAECVPSSSISPRTASAVTPTARSRGVERAPSMLVRVVAIQRSPCDGDHDHLATHRRGGRADASSACSIEPGGMSAQQRHRRRARMTTDETDHERTALAEDIELELTARIERR